LKGIISFPPRKINQPSVIRYYLNLLSPPLVGFFYALVNIDKKIFLWYNYVRAEKTEFVKINVRRKR